MTASCRSRDGVNTWYGPRPTYHWYTPAIEFLHSRLVVSLFLVLGVFGIILIGVSVAKLKTGGGSIETTCSGLDIFTSIADPSVCPAEVEVLGCGSNAVISQTESGVPFYCNESQSIRDSLLFTANETCYVMNCTDPVAYLNNPDPTAWLTPGTSDLIVLLLGVILLGFLLLGIVFFQRSMTRLPKRRELPF
ncbi:hypothetical protein DIPPA_70027 [Diplonema papillatum]|nr:hypothetical protein DIPPA_70027 [Diplonema papillatum]